MAGSRTLKAGAGRSSVIEFSVGLGTRTYVNQREKS
jgi:hypothetical protein